ncbi:UNKNOWN [Stylonychia lemnae]|uniref:Uncharacterized protein n=1 Tax=Stylonychia lemnae TaxID=5949 RepID=A0A077ZXB5_STYLE|nr:UNKNOWN [Stylonychia lemnae]|eukprot:CDW73877.1 UNKNOWN [Stylonychia lemnae]
MNIHPIGIIPRQQFNIPNMKNISRQRPRTNYMRNKKRIIIGQHDQKNYQSNQMNQLTQYNIPPDLNRTMTPNILSQAYEMSQQPRLGLNHTQIIDYSSNNSGFFEQRKNSSIENKLIKLPNNQGISPIQSNQISNNVSQNNIDYVTQRFKVGNNIKQSNIRQRPQSQGRPRTRVNIQNFRNQNLMGLGGFNGDDNSAQYSRSRLDQQNQFQPQVLESFEMNKNDSLNLL